MFFLSLPVSHLSSSGHPLQPFLHFLDPLLFGLGLTALPFHHTYLEFLCDVTQRSTSHLPMFVGKTHRVTGHLVHFVADPAVPRLLAYPRLKDSGFPSHAPRTVHSIKEARQAPTSPGARTMSVVSVGQNVRTYTPDLVKTAAS
jgi:hypothetical protein